MLCRTILLKTAVLIAGTALYIVLAGTAFYIGAAVAAPNVAYAPGGGPLAATAAAQPVVNKIGAAEPAPGRRRQVIDYSPNVAPASDDRRNRNIY